MRPRVVLLAPSRLSIYSLCVAEELRRRDVDVAGLAVTRLVDPRRLLRELEWDGRRLAGKVWQKIVMRERSSSAGETLADRRAQLGITHRSLDDLAEAITAPLVYTTDLNSAGVCALLDEIRPALVVFTGGGLIREPVFARAGAGVLNCHSGVLPPYRGMDVVEWAVLEGRLDQLGLTVHFMDRGIDTGDVVHVEHVPLEPGETLESYRPRLLARMSIHLAESAARFLDGTRSRRPQQHEAGRQYYIMHPRLARLLKPKAAG